MQSGIEENIIKVDALETELKIEKTCSPVFIGSDKDFKPIDSQSQVDLEKNKNVETAKYNSKNKKPLTPCLKKRNSSETIIQTGAGKNKKCQYKLKNKSQASDTTLITKPTGFSKILTWDPWHKIGRNKTKKNKHKNEKQKITATDHLKGDGPKPIILEKKPEETTVYESEISNSEYAEFNDRQLKNSKIVRFHADVKVFHYKEDEILDQTIEPLKKELEQQERNKELRKEVSPETGLGLKQKKSASDYMSAWYKK